MSEAAAEDSVGVEDSPSDFVFVEYRLPNNSGACRCVPMKNEPEGGVQLKTGCDNKEREPTRIVDMDDSRRLCRNLGLFLIS